MQKIFCSNIFYFEVYFTIIWLLYNIFIVVFLVLNNLTNYGRRHSKLSCFVGHPVLNQFLLELSCLFNIFSYFQMECTAQLEVLHWNLDFFVLSCWVEKLFIKSKNWFVQSLVGSDTVNTWININQCFNILDAHLIFECRKTCSKLGWETCV